jgi:hypothetical protein
VPLSPRLLPAPKPGRVGLIASWQDDDALDTFLADHPLAKLLEGGYRARLEPVRVVGAWPELGELPRPQAPVGEGPAAVLTLGRLRLRRALAFLRASARAEHDALTRPTLVLGTALGRPPGLVATFSVWSEIPSMRDYAGGGGHEAATSAHADRPFHSASAFIRYRIREQLGEWKDPREAFPRTPATRMVSS